MLKKICISIILIGILVLHGCSNKEEKEAAIKKEKMLLSDEQLWSQIISKQQQYDTDPNWMGKLGFISTEKKGFRKLYTYEIEDAFMNRNNILLIGTLEDIKNANQSEFYITVSLSSFSLEMKNFISPKIKFSFTCPKLAVESLKIQFNDTYKKYASLGIRVAVVTKIGEI
jgi:hypothetical protein